MSQLAKKLTALLKPTVEGLSFVLWGVEYLSQGKHSVLRIYIDHENGIDVDDCSEVSQQVGAVLDIEDPIRGEYVLEVSSPGMARPLFEPEQYRAYCGEGIKCQTLAPIDGQCKFKGIIQQSGDVTFTLQLRDSEQTIDIAYANIQKAQLVSQFT